MGSYLPVGDVVAFCCLVSASLYWGQYLFLVWTGRCRMPGCYCVVCVCEGGRGFMVSSRIFLFFFPGLCGVVFLGEAPRTMFKAKAIRG